MSNELKLGNPLVVGNASSDPATGFNGEIYYNTTSNLFRVYQNGAWANLSTGSVSLTGQTLDANNIIIGDDSTNLSDAVDTSSMGDILADNSAGLTIKSGVITNSEINSGAAISVSKLSTITASSAVATDSSGYLTASSTSATELGYVHGVTSAIQTQLNSITSSYVPNSEVGQADGVASLDGSGKVPVGQLPSVVMEYQGAWNPNTNNPLLSDKTQYTFTVTSANATAGATYTNNTQTFTVLQTISSATTLITEGSGAPSASGTLTLSSGTGDSTITFSIFSTGSTPQNGNVYYVSTADSNTVPGLSDPSMYNFQIGDLIIYSSTAVAWQLVTPAAGVQSVNGAQGAVTVNAINQLTGDITTEPASGSESEAATISAGAVTASKLGTVTDGTTLDQSGAGSTLEIKSGGVGTTQLASASVTTAKLGTITDGTTLDQSGAGSTLEIKSGGVGTTQLGTITDNITLDQSGASSTLEVKSGGISDTQVNSSAAIALTKLAALTANVVPVTNSSGFLTSSSASGVQLVSTNLQRGASGSAVVTEYYVDSTTLTDNSGPTSVTAFAIAYASYAGEQIDYVIETGQSPSNCRMGTLLIVSTSTGSATSITDTFTETADCGVSWTASTSAGNILVSYTTTSQSSNRTLRADLKQFRR